MIGTRPMAGCCPPGRFPVAGTTEPRGRPQARWPEPAPPGWPDRFARTQLATSTADAAAVTNEGLTLAAHWDQLSPEERTVGLLNIAFWGHGRHKHHRRRSCFA